MLYQVVGETAMMLHFAFVAYVVLGGFLAWRWPRTFWLHLPFAAYSLSINIIGWECPLTHVEDWGRVNAGQRGIADVGFIDHYFTGVLYPREHAFTAQILAGLTVAVSWAGLLLLWWRRRGHTPERPPA